MRNETMLSRGVGWTPLSAAALLLALLVAAGPALCGEETGAAAREAEAERGMNFYYVSAPLETVLDRIGTAAGGLNILVDAEDPEQQKELERMPVTLKLTQATWETALKVLAKKYKFVVNWEMRPEGVVVLERPPRVTMNVDNAPIQNVIRLIAQDAGANIIIGPEVQGTVSFSINDVPWKEALDSILKTHGYVQVEEPSGVIRITTPEQVEQQLEVRVFVLRYVAGGESPYQAVLQSEYVQRTGGEEGGDESTLLEVLDGIKSENGSISYERATSQLIIKDTATKLDEMGRVIREVDKAPLQVQIQTRILTVTEGGPETGKRMGVQWANGFTSSISGGSWGTTFPYAIDSPVDSENAFGQLGPWSAAVLPTEVGMPREVQDFGFGAYDSNGMALGTMDMTGLTATLQLAENDETVTLLQAPELLAMDNQEATIHVAQVIRYAEYYTESNESGQITTGYREAGQIEDGVQLLVVPHVIPDVDRVILTVVPKTEDFNGFDIFNEGQANELKLPRTTNKIVVTRMMLDNKETGVIAGLLNDRFTEAYTKVPILGDVPILGRLFKSESTNRQKTNVAILITPTIIKPDHRKDFEADLAALGEDLADIE